MTVENGSIEFYGDSLPIFIDNSIAFERTGTKFGDSEHFYVLMNNSGLAKRVADEKLSTKFMEWKTRPHLTLACFNDVDEEKCIEQLKKFAQTHKQMPAYIGSVGMFTDSKTIFASPMMNDSMYQFQRELHECLKDFDATGWEWYRPNRWMPHCTLALTKEDDEDVFYKASDLILHEFRKMSGKFVSVGLVKVTFPVDEICTIDLEG